MESDELESDELDSHKLDSHELEVAGPYDGNRNDPNRRLSR